VTIEVTIPADIGNQWWYLNLYDRSKEWRNIDPPYSNDNNNNKPKRKKHAH
jgi:hypothetical protein